jgi:hypothetical protein
MIYKISVHASQKTHYVSCTEINRLMLLRKGTLFTERTVYTKRKESVGRMYSRRIVNLMVYIYIYIYIYRVFHDFRT